MRSVMLGDDALDRPVALAFMLVVETVELR